MSRTTLDDHATAPVTVVHMIRGEVDHGTPVDLGRLTAPALDLDRLVWPRTEPGPAFHVPVAEIVDLLVETGEALKADRAGLLAEALERMAPVSPLPAEVLERAYAVLWRSFQRPGLYAQIDHELGGADVLDGWREVRLPDERVAAIRAFPPRLVHIIAGNAPGVAAMSVVRGALTKGVNLVKLPSNDLFTATAILRTMAAVAPGHPVVRSFSAAYWRGGDEVVESALFRPQFFDKLVAWGGEATIRSALKYVGPGFELVSFDPKTSISMIGREAFASEETLARAADAGAADATFFNQQACVASRFQFVEGSRDDADRYAALLCERLGTAREFSSAAWPAGRPGTARGDRRPAVHGTRLPGVGRLRRHGPGHPLTGTRGLPPRREDRRRRPGRRTVRGRRPCRGRHPDGRCVPGHPQGGTARRPRLRSAYNAWSPSAGRAACHRASRTTASTPCNGSCGG